MRKRNSGMPRSPRQIRKRDLVVKIASEAEKKLLWQNRVEFEVEPEKARFSWEHGKTFVALLNGEIVAYCQAHYIPKNLAVISRISAVRNMKYKGIGRTLIGRVEGYYIRKGVKKFYGYYAIPIKNFYAKTGHEITEVAGQRADFEREIKTRRKPQKLRNIRI